MNLDHLKAGDRIAVTFPAVLINEKCVQIGPRHDALVIGRWFVEENAEAVSVIEPEWQVGDIVRSPGGAAFIRIPAADAEGGPFLWRHCLTGAVAKDYVVRRPLTLLGHTDVAA